MSDTTVSQDAAQAETVVTPDNALAQNPGTEQTSTETTAETEPTEVEETLPPGLKKRIDKLTAQKYEARRQAEDAANKAASAASEAEVLRATIAELRKEQASTEATQSPTAATNLSERDIEIKAKELNEVRQFNEKANATYEEGKTKFKDFEESVSMLRNVGVMNKSFLDAVFEVGSAPEILQFLGQNPDEADRLRSMSPVKLGVEMSKLVAKVNKPKPVSAAPAPIVSVDGTAKGAEDFDKMSTEERILFRRKERAAARR